ncbi:MAG: tRNA 2-thiocytidine(32) synthetase TtcA, partial [Lachnospiraceae bacterium]|nr:tRNA 2-thiocytidine(32) synthetase TtcA [Lachnospiraceae bacterium]
MQRILSTMRKAIEKYNMIDEGDKIVVGLSGGK